MIAKVPGASTEVAEECLKELAALYRAYAGCLDRSAALLSNIRRKELELRKAFAAAQSFSRLGHEVSVVAVKKKPVRSGKKDP